MTPTPPSPDSVQHSMVINYVLIVVTLIFALLMIGVVWFMPMQDKLFVVLVGLVTGFASAFMTRIQAPPVHIPGSPAPATNGDVTQPPQQAAEAALKAAMAGAIGPGPVPLKSSGA